MNKIAFFIAALIGLSACSHKIAQGEITPVSDVTFEKIDGTPVAFTDAVKEYTLADSAFESRIPQDVSPRTLIISYDSEVGKQPLLDAVKAYKASILYDYQNFNMVAISLPEGADLVKSRSHFKKVKGVLSVEYDHIMHLH